MIKKLLFSCILSVQFFQISAINLSDSAYCYNKIKNYYKAIYFCGKYLNGETEKKDIGDTYFILAQSLNKKKLTANAIDNYLLAIQLYQFKST